MHEPGNPEAPPAAGSPPGPSGIGCPVGGRRRREADVGHGLRAHDRADGAGRAALVLRWLASTVSFLLNTLLLVALIGGRQVPLLQGPRQLPLLSNHERDGGDPRGRAGGTGLPACSRAPGRPWRPQRRMTPDRVPRTEWGTLHAPSGRWTCGSSRPRSAARRVRGRAVHVRRGHGRRGGPHQAINPALNAVVVDLGDDAIATAEAADRAMAAGEPIGPWHGVPATIKQNIDVQGQPTPNGLPALADNIAPGGSAVTANLRRAGAIFVGRTNVPEQPCNKRVPGSGCPAITGEHRNHAILGWSCHCVATNPSDMAVRWPCSTRSCTTRRSTALARSARGVLPASRRRAKAGDRVAPRRTDHSAQPPGVRGVAAVADRKVRERPLLYAFANVAIAADWMSPMDRFGVRASALVVSRRGRGALGAEGALQGAGRPLADGRVHRQYELMLTNTVPLAVDVTAVEVHGDGRRIEVLSGAALQAAMAPLGSETGTTTELPASTARDRLAGPQLRVEASTPHPGQPSAHRRHRSRPARRTDDHRHRCPCRGLDSASDHHRASAARGTMGGRRRAEGPHRRALQAINGQLRLSQRFAVDFAALLDDEGRSHKGDPDQNSSYFNYGQPALAVGAGTVVEAVDGLPDQIPNHNAPVPLADAGGNEVILRLDTDAAEEAVGRMPTAGSRRRATPKPPLSRTFSGDDGARTHDLLLAKQML